MNCMPLDSGSFFPIVGCNRPAVERQPVPMTQPQSVIGFRQHTQYPGQGRHLAGLRLKHQMLTICAQVQQSDDDGPLSDFGMHGSLAQFRQAVHR